MCFLPICRKRPLFMWRYMRVRLNISQIRIQDTPGFSNAIYNIVLSRPTTVFHQPLLSTQSSITLNQLLSTLACVFSHCFLHESICNSNAFNRNAEKHLLLMNWGLILTIRQCRCFCSKHLQHASVLQLKEKLIQRERELLECSVLKV